MRLAFNRLFLLFVFGLFQVSAHAVEVDADYYKNKTIFLDIGVPPGGGNDLYGRIFAKYLGSHIPGQPKVIARNMEGAGGLRVANYIYTSAPKDGTEIALVLSSAIMQPLLGEQDNARFNPELFTWIGSLNKEIAGCALWYSADVKNFEDTFKRKIRLGASGPTGIMGQQSLILKNLLGVQADIIFGYTGATDVMLAMQRGEVDGMCAVNASTLMSQWKEDWTAKRMNVFVQLGLQNHRAFGAAPNIFNFAKTDQEKMVLRLLLGQSLIGRPIVAPPGTTAEASHILRKAMFETLADPEFIDESQRLNLEFDAVSAQDIEAFFAEYKSYPPEIIERAKNVLKVQ